jgi:hypothetical protein
LIKSLDLWGKTSVDAEYFSLHNCSDTEIIEYLSAVFPGVSITVLSDCLIIETINSSNLSSLVISSQQGDVSRILKLKAEEELESFD